MTFWQFWKNKQLWAVENLLRTAINNQETIMGILDDLKTVVSDIATDAMQQHDEVMVAIDHIVKAVDLEANPDLKAAVTSLQTSHTAFTDSLKTLKDKVDAVVASSGPAA